VTFPAFAEQVGLRLEPFQKKIAKAAAGPERELVVLLPRGQGKTTLLAALAVHHLLTMEARPSTSPPPRETRHASCSSRPPAS